jgi:hypothetical protein
LLLHDIAGNKLTRIAHFATVGSLEFHVGNRAMVQLGFMIKGKAICPTTRCADQKNKKYDPNHTLQYTSKEAHKEHMICCPGHPVRKRL